MSSCKIDFKKKPIKWEINTIDEKCINEGKKILDSLYAAEEYSGRFQFELKKDKMVSELLDFKKGNSNSVETVPGMINFHTHNYPNYMSEKCIFATASGDDMRECVRFGLQGNLCHLVFAMEGTYVIQVNPCYLNILKRDIKFSDKIKGDTARGAIVYLIECYFKATHGHRTKEYNKMMEKKKLPICQPEDWVKFANNFKFQNFFSKKNACSKNLPCNGIPEYNSFGSGTMCPIKYMDTYGTDGQFKLDKSGRAFETDKDTAIEILEHHFDKLVKLFDSGCNKGSGIIFDRGQWFYTKFFPNKFKYKNEFVSYSKLTKQLKTTDNIFNYIKHCGKTKDCIKFDRNNLPYIDFHPLNKPTCKIKVGKELLKWINGTKV
jgi:hypothetical protein